MDNKKNFSNEIRAYALKNAIEFGKVDASKILPKLFQHGLEKIDIKEVMPIILRFAEEVNKLSEEDRKKHFANYEKYILVKEEQKNELPELHNISKKMVFRLAPFPSGDLHIGNAKTYLLNALYAEKYNGKILLVMDDTIGSAEKQIVPESYELIKESFDWLGVKYNKKIIYKSDRLKIYYKYAEKLIRKGFAYVCHCLQEQMRENRKEGKECSCRQFSAKMQLKRWKEIFNLKEGLATLRIKTDMQHPNPAFRDRVLFKISDRTHPRIKNKFRVWPTLEMSWAIDDYLLGITHILRGNDLTIETDMEKFIWDIFGWKHIETIHTGLVKIEGIEGAKLSKSKSQEEVKSGNFVGWDDPRTWSIHSLKKRGISPEAVREFVKELGVNKSDISVPIDVLYSINRKIIDKEADRYSFIVSPVKIQIENNPGVKFIEVPIHPDRKETRKLKVENEIFINGEDFNKYKNREIRLLHLFNLILKEKSKISSIDNKNIQKINWVCENVQCGILMPDGNWKEGIAEISISELKENSLIQFERFGFVKFIGKRKNIYEFYFTHP